MRRFYSSTVRRIHGPTVRRYCGSTVKWVVMFVLCSAAMIAQESVHISGTIRDQVSGEPLRFVTIRALGTKAGTISAKDGEYVLQLAGEKLQRARKLDSLMLVFSLVGYRSDTVIVSLADQNVDVTLEEQAFRTRTVVVSGEDPGVRIMRRLLERKARQEERLERYTYMLYTKFVAITDTVTAMRSTGLGDSTVFSILESFSKGYVEEPDRFHNEILQRRQTANIPPQANFVAFGTNLNIFDDELSILGEQIETPFHPDAIDDYEFLLKSDETQPIVEILVRPKSDGFKAFFGTLFIDQQNNYPIEVRLQPNASVNLPFDASLEVRQTFIEVDDVIVPEALSILSSLKADLWFVMSPRLDIDLETYCYDYEIDAEFSDDVFDMRRVEITSAADEYDTTFWDENLKLPLRPEEEYAYEEIERFRENPDSLEGGIFDSFLGPIATAMTALNREPFSTTDDVFRYNRIHGPYLGLGLQFRPDTVVEFSFTGGYGFNDKRWYGSAGATVFLDPIQQWSIDGNAYSVLQRRDNPFLVRRSLITVTSLLFGNDYGDYYYADGWEAGAAYTWGQLRFLRGGRWGRANMVRAFVRSERQRSAASHDTWALFRGDNVQRMNPSIMDGNLQSIGGEVFLGYHPVRRLSRTGMYLFAEHSDPSLLASDFDFTRLDWTGFFRTRTWPLFTLDVLASVGWTWGDVPPQRFFSLESSVSGIAVGSAFRVMQVKEFYGDRYAVLSLAHNWGEIVPGLLRIPNVAAFGIEFITFGSVGWTQFGPRTLEYTRTELPSTDVTREQVYYELGLGINRLLLFFRFDVNVRLSQVDTPKWQITVTSATF